MRLFVDSAPYYKLIKARATGADVDLVFMFAGDAKVIDVWKQAMRLLQTGKPTTPFYELPVDGMNVVVATNSASDLLFQYGMEFDVGDDASFAGTGSYGAAECWVKNRCALTAVESAKQTDAFTGGPVKYINLITGENNLADDEVDLNQLIEAFRNYLVSQAQARLVTGESSMEKMTNNVDTSRKSANAAELESAQVSAQLTSFDQAVAAGAAPKAPCDAYFKPWPGEERQRFVELMSSLFPQPSRN